ncbi:aminotransferase class I/II-fold pyridoxal phosphate-dependent enzyme [Arcobacter sp. FWKO B]|uniref:aminotransferase class I/II-fold pyridoxal phosphate-dependent enzyme n=1 Tax=Arcobacter sp. FWKO B TaxID=2593672 RepID=UPI0018A69CA8|nr:aminotransferase class I/II-fold pyridoxal phosphate-dependent enzyme [Arcobacter sp. FWKO B]QOG12465.1 histidinol-phosphate aminotransferase family protein [Arcobacter sp. FWKO B]
MIEFAHGGDIKAFAKAINCEEKQIIDLSSNINFIKPKFKLNQTDISTYPNYDNLYCVLSKHFSVDKEKLEVYNGGSSAIFSLMRNIKTKRCYIYSPAYLEYKKSAILHSKELILIDRFKNMDTVIEKDSLVVFVNPSTPDGRYYDIEKLFEMWTRKNATIIIDESFLEFSQKESTIKYLKNYDKLYILKSLTKFYSCAGVRLGVVISSEENIKNLKSLEPLWKISAFDSEFISHILQNKKFKQKTLHKNQKAKEYLKKILEKSPLIDKVFESDANFFLVKLSNISAQEFAQKLICHKIMVRDCSNFDFLDNSYVRIAVKSKKDLKVLKKGLKCPKN